MDENLLKMDGFDDAILGVGYDIATGVNRLVYDGEVMVSILIARDCLSEEEAREYISFNCEGAYVGPSTPLIIWSYSD
jgi:hypothetical protein